MSEKKLSPAVKKALIVSRKHICPNTTAVIKTYADLGFWWKIIYWVTFVVTFGKVKMTNYAFVLGASMYTDDVSTVSAGLVMHEAVHMRQREKIGRLLFYINYLFMLPSIFTMRSLYESDAYVVSAVVNSLLRYTSFAASSKEDPFRQEVYRQVLAATRSSIEYSINTQFFNFGYFFMSVLKKRTKKRMYRNANAVLNLMFGINFIATPEQDRFLDETNIVDALYAFYK